MENIDMRALFSMTYGLYVVSTSLDGKLNGQTANAVLQITNEPISVTTCLNKANLTTDMIKESKIFSVAILEQEVPMTFIGRFGFKSGRDIDKFEETKYVLGETGAPMITDWSIANYEAKVTKMMDLSTHVLFIGEVVSANFLKEAVPLTYADYHTNKKGKSPETAPTVIFNDLK